MCAVTIQYLVQLQELRDLGTRERRLTLVSSAGCCGPDLQIEDRVLRRVAAWMGVVDNLFIVGYLLLTVETESAVKHSLPDGWESQVQQGQG